MSFLHTNTLPNIENRSPKPVEVRNHLLSRKGQGLALGAKCSAIGTVTKTDPYMDYKRRLLSRAGRLELLH